MSATNVNSMAESVKELLSPLLEKGFTYRYFHEKGGDSSCVYISRFQKGKDFFDWREISGGEDVNFVAYVNGAYRFPSLKMLYKKQVRVFGWKHIFQKASLAEKRAFYASLLLQELEKPDFFGIIL